ncbi:MAG: phosphotransferase family protein [Kofleriaceae bacterium]
MFESPATSVTHRARPPAVTDPRVFPLVDVSRDELEELAGGALARVERVEGGYTNTLHRVTRVTGEKLVVRHHAGGARPFEEELAVLERLAGTLPVPDVVRVDRRRHAIVYRWIEGITLDECRRTQPPEAFASLAGPLGRMFAWLARVEPIGAPWRLEPLLAQARVQLLDGRARHRLGAPLADAIARALDEHADRLAWGTPCLSHGDIGGRNLLVARATADRWRIAGLIDWESAAGGSPLVDLGALFREAQRFDSAFVATFERGYREADGALPVGWWLTARLLDALGIVDILDENRELPGVFADGRRVLAKLIADLRAR